MTRAGAFLTLALAVQCMACEADERSGTSAHRAGVQNLIGVWRSDAVSLVVVEQSAEQRPLVAAVADAARQVGPLWEASCGEPKLRVGGPMRLSTGVKRDGVNAIVVHNKVWCYDGRRNARCYPAQVPAMTTVYRSETSKDGRTRVIEEADIELNAVHYDWLGNEPSKAAARASLHSVLLHELGHVLGLGDTPGNLRVQRTGVRSRAGATSVMAGRRADEALSGTLRPSTEDLAMLCAAYSANMSPVQ